MSWMVTLENSSTFYHYLSYKVESYSRLGQTFAITIVTITVQATTTCHRQSAVERSYTQHNTTQPNAPDINDIM